ncbi:energy-coupling factor transporter transmembrane component T family protein [Georgenia thermotolerans]|uniref:Energy-coupling factor transporter transmembrane protein EcfT n=1 Tax=Georgenia thermotolerans TaxID=527326 RepID=A0A7J5UUT5_9MICO|nr:energy-coupling factor transporter transmembrane component T [Georgenia thermotolerans]KAE8766036.1 energy-coupling factor transporter transmembrane protein EcfT [Georgenia thermotolerans]
MSAPGVVGRAAGAVADSPLARRNPTVKLALLLVVSLVVMFVLDPLTPAVLYLLALAAVAAGTRAAPRTLLVAHAPFALFALGVLVVNALSRPGAVLWQAGPLRVTVEGVEIGVALAARTLLVGVLAIGFLLSTDGVALMTSLHQNARLGARVTYAILAGYRMLQEMPREWATISQAHAVRADLSGGHGPRGPRHLAGVVFTLLVVSVRKGERMAQALESRGLGLTPRTTWRPVLVTGADWALAAVVLGVLALVLAGSAALGVLQGPGALTP